MDHNMGFSYDYGKQKRGSKIPNAPLLWAILMAKRAQWSDTDGITQCGMSRATLEATGQCHWATTCSVLPQRPPGQQQMKRGQKYTPTLLAVSVAMAMLRYVTARIARWRRSRVLLKATERQHWASLC
jgi:hypothetical protein